MQGSEARRGLKRNERGRSMPSDAPRIKAEFHNGLLCSWRCCDRSGMSDDDLARHLAAHHDLGHDTKVLARAAPTVPVERIRVDRAQLKADEAELRACFEQIRIRREQLYAECPHPTRGSGGPMDPPGPRCAECGKIWPCPGETDREKEWRGLARRIQRSLHSAKLWNGRDSPSVASFIAEAMSVLEDIAGRDQPESFQKED